MDLIIKKGAQRVDITLDSNLKAIKVDKFGARFYLSRSDITKVDKALEELNLGIPYNYSLEESYISISTEQGEEIQFNL